MLQVLSFDVGETLIDFYYLDHVWNEVIPQLFARKRGLDFKDAKDFVLKEYDRIGSNDVRWYLPEYWFKHFSLQEDPIGVFRLHADKIRFYPEVTSVLGSLSQKYDLIIATGIPTNIVEIIIEKIRNNFKHIFSPVSDLQQVKKTRRFYEMICNALRIKPSHLAHIGDDNYYDFTVPRKIGIKSFLLDRKGEKRGKFVIKDLTELEERLHTQR